MRSVSVLLAVLLLVAPAAHGQGSAWQSFGSKMKESGKAFGDAVSKSVRGEGNREEWREVGDELSGAGKAGAKAVETTAEKATEDEPAGGASAGDGSDDGEPDATTDDGAS